MHRLLARQLRKAFNGNTPPEAEPLLDLVDEAYRAADEDRALLERAMDVAGEELTERNEELAARIRELEDAQKRLAEADRWRRRFINAAAHELSTPLTPIKLQIYALKSTADEAIRPSILVLERNVDRLALLVSDLLDAAKIQSDHLPLRPEQTDLVIIVQGAIEALTAMAHDQDVTISADMPEMAMVEADPARIAQVVDNLLSNAIKFSRGGRVTIRLDVDDHVSLHVQDDGIGIDPNALKLLFRPFTRVHANEAEIPGTGLGLYVSRGIVEASGGKLTARSKGLGKGTTFTATLPAW